MNDETKQGQQQQGAAQEVGGAATGESSGSTTAVSALTDGATLLPASDASGSTPTPSGAATSRDADAPSAAITGLPDSAYPGASAGMPLAKKYLLEQAQRCEEKAAGTQELASRSAEEAASFFRAAADYRYTAHQLREAAKKL
ncbi:hypothetical protein [Burkholderia gladioli]|uniref:hypothetical protein n=1 Tax=Burkholderia gladioli TaxID=28095 RepID=UPI00163FD57E|nr:hypothetical protein [Burkholderia gladioli]